MSEIEWKIEDDVLYVREGGYWLAQEPNLTRVFRAAVEAEREACARIADNSKGPTNLTRNRCCDTIATAIRARGEG